MARENAAGQICVLAGAFLNTRKDVRMPVYARSEPPLPSPTHRGNGVAPEISR